MQPGPHTTPFCGLLICTEKIELQLLGVWGCGSEFGAYHWKRACQVALYHWQQHRDSPQLIVGQQTMNDSREVSEYGFAYGSEL